MPAIVDGTLPTGSFEMTCVENSQTYILDAFSWDEAGADVGDRYSAEGTPMGGGVLRDFVKGSGDMQLTDRAQPVPDVGNLFTLSELGFVGYTEDTAIYMITSVGKTFESRGIVKAKISFRKCVNPMITAPVAAQSVSTGGAITPIPLASNETTGITFSATGLPTGLSVVSTNITGTPTTTGTFRAIITATTTNGKVDGRINRAGSRVILFTVT
jgi:hypothetical protein